MRALALLGLLLVCSCSAKPAPARAVPTAEVERVRVELAHLAQVSAAQVRYVTGPAVTGNKIADVTLTVGPGASTITLRREVAEVIWKSRITPLDAVDLAFAKSRGSQPFEQVVIDFFGDQAASLTRELGPRPLP